MSNKETVPVRSGENIDQQALQQWLDQQAPGLGNIAEISQFPGGFSNLTYLLRTSTGDYVLRRPPVGANIKSAHDMGREYRVLSLLKGHYDKIPAPVVYCESPEAIGYPFYIMTRLEGLILRPQNAPKLNFTPAQWRDLSTALVDNLVDIHALDIHASGLAALGKPEGYVQRQVEGWIKRYYAAETDTLEAMNAVAQWLQHNLPPEQTPAFLHNDYKFDNVLFDPGGLRQVTGVLDWEMSTVGDPLMDLGAALAWWIEAADGEAMYAYNATWLPGNLSRREAAERYAEKSGRRLDHIVFYYVFGLFKNAVIGQQIYARWKQGLTQDARFGHLLPMIQSLGAKGQHTLMGGKL